jgi:hypothetical protein
VEAPECQGKNLEIYSALVRKSVQGNQMWGDVFRFVNPLHHSRRLVLKKLKFVQELVRKPVQKGIAAVDAPGVEFRTST